MVPGALGAAGTIRGVPGSPLNIASIAATMLLGVVPVCTSAVGVPLYRVCLMAGTVLMALGTVGLGAVGVIHRAVVMDAVGVVYLAPGSCAVLMIHNAVIMDAMLMILLAIPLCTMIMIHQAVDMDTVLMGKGTGFFGAVLVIQDAPVRSNGGNLFPKGGYCKSSRHKHHRNSPC